MNILFIMYAKYCLILADYCLCHHNDHLNNLLGHNNSKNEHVPGWMIDVEYVQPDEDYLKKWFGYNYYSGGSVNTTLFGCGNATLNFGNCFDFGEVAAYKNGKELGMANANENKTIAFEFFDGDSIEIRGYGGIILLNNFVQDPCPGKSKIFIH